MKAAFFLITTSSTWRLWYLTAHPPGCSHDVVRNVLRCHSWPPYKDKIESILHVPLLEVIRNCCGFCFTTLCDWFKKLAPPTQPIRTKTNGDSVGRVFPRLAPVTCFSFELFTSVVLGRCNWFGFDFTTLNRKPLQCDIITEELEKYKVR